MENTDLQHIRFMKMAIDLSKSNVEKAMGGPFGAVIVKDGKVIAKSANKVTATNDPTAHAEIAAIRLASKKLNSFDLSDCIIYTSCEPCPMCLGAIYWSRISKIYYACTKHDAAEAGYHKGERPWLQAASRSTARRSRASRAGSSTSTGTASAPSSA
ncbi:MAG: nucleoside deaminase, partial [Sphingobacteriaceae bacterium]